MRLSGFALLIVGFFLCITVAWAALGFLAMSFGLICLLIAEERKKKRRLSQVAKKPIDPDRAGPFRQLIEENAKRNERAYEADKWKSIVKADPDIESVVKILSQYGPSYVDQLAKVYLVFEDKTLLPIILELIVTSAKKHLETRKTSSLGSAPSIGFGIALNSVGRDETAGHTRQSAPEMAYQPSEGEPYSGLQGSHMPTEPSSVSGDGSVADSSNPSQDAVTSSPSDAEDLRALLSLLSNRK
jgi:hypothetical protein